MAKSKRRTLQQATAATWPASFIYIICQLLPVFKFSTPTLYPTCIPLAWVNNPDSDYNAASEAKRQLLPIQTYQVCVRL